MIYRRGAALNSTDCDVERAREEKNWTQIVSRGSEELVLGGADPKYVKTTWLLE
jgi:hypothetical protein